MTAEEEPGHRGQEAGASQVVQNKPKLQEFRQDIIIRKKVTQTCYGEKSLISTVFHFTFIK